MAGVKSPDKIFGNTQAEKKFMEAIREGDASSFEAIFRIYCQQLVNFAFRFVRDTGTAESLVQDVFLKIWMDRNKLNPSLSIKSYLYTAVKNQALKHIRHLRVEARSGGETIPMYDEPPRTPEEELNEREIGEAVLHAIEQLPESRRNIFMMNRYDGLTYAEIAEIESISIKTVETQMGRALKFLRESLSHFLSIVIFLPSMIKDFIGEIIRLLSG